MTVELTFRSDMVVGLVDHMGGDESVLRAMLVASDKEGLVVNMEESAKRGRINSLMRERHGSPFEHNAMTFYVEAPIFVFREWHRHRVGISINEQSGRYSELPPMFYVPSPERPMIRVEGTKQMDYVMVPAEENTYYSKIGGDKIVFQAAYDEYLRQIDMGIAKEAARNVLPVAIYSKMYWTCNARSLMAFLSLRVRAEAWDHYADIEGGGDLQELNRGRAMFPSKPQWEINQCANLMEHAAEECFRTLFPMTHEAFINNGRVCP
jgi:thymidylate synthase (FAD)